MRQGKNQFTHPWSPEELQHFVQNYPSLFPEEKDHVFPYRSEAALRQKAADLGIHKERRVVRNANEYNNSVDGGYVSGLVDGEGCFAITSCRTDDKFPGYGVQLAVSLRADDAEVVNWLKTYFGGGRIHTTHRKTKYAPMITWAVSRLYEVAKCVLPHFDRYPLRAKKKHDYAVWREAVELLCAKPVKCWTEKDLETMQSLQNKLSEGRRYTAFHE